MRVCYIFLIFTILFGTTILMPQNGKEEQALSVTTDSYKVTVEENGCLTVRNISGICVQRARCDFGPGAIDFTLYAPQWYKRPCKVEEACCPLEFLIEEKKVTNTPDGFEFDADD